MSFSSIFFTRNFLRIVQPKVVDENGFKKVFYFIYFYKADALSLSDEICLIIYLFIFDIL